MYGSSVDANRLAGFSPSLELGLKSFRFLALLLVLDDNGIYGFALRVDPLYVHRQGLSVGGILLWVGQPRLGTSGSDKHACTCASPRSSPS